MIAVCLRQIRRGDLFPGEYVCWLRGRGHFRGIELVEERGTKAPFDPAKGVAAKIRKAVFTEGLICCPMSGNIDGQCGDHILLAPAFIIEDSQLGELTEKLSKAISAVI